MKVPDVAPVPPLVDVIAEVLAEHWTFSTHGDFDALADRCDGCHADIFTHGHGADQKTAWAIHQARAVLTALTKAGNVEWAVQDPTDGELGAVTGNPDDVQEMRGQIAEAKKHDIDVQLVSRFTGTWTAAE